MAINAIFGTSVVGQLLGQHNSEFPDNNYYLGNNGQWGPGRNGFLGIGGGNGTLVSLRIDFVNGPVSFVGGLFNYSPSWPPVSMAALAQDFSVIEQRAIEVEAPIDTYSQIDKGEFRGIASSQNDIYALQLTAPFAVIDDLSFFRTVPEPSSILLFFGSFVLILFGRNT